MNYKFLGNTGVLVSELCFGTMTFGGVGYWSNMGKVGQDDATQLIKVAVDGGINFIDTANVYSYGESESLLGKAIKSLGLNRHELFIASKIRGRMDAKSLNNVGLNRLHIHRSIDESLLRMGLSHLDMLYIHGFDAYTPIEETMRGLNEMVQSGKVRYIAACNIPAWIFMKANGIAEKNGWAKFDGMQYYYSIAGRDVEREILPLAKSEKIGFMPWSPLAGGFLSGKYSRSIEKAGDSRRDVFDFPPVNKEKAYDIIDVMTEFAQNHDVSVARIALAWVNQQPGVTSVIIGAKTVAQLEDNIAASSLRLSADELSLLDNVSALTKEYPQWMVERQGGDRFVPL